MQLKQFATQVKILPENRTQVVKSAQIFSHQPQDISFQKKKQAHSMANIPRSRGCVAPENFCKVFKIFSLHQNLWYMHKALNIDKK